jgi:hypothetical protein
VSVKIADDEGFYRVAYYKGTIGSDEAERAGVDAGGVITCGHTENTPPGSTCKCQRLTARIVPSSLRAEPLVRQETLHLRFTVHWLLSCSSGKGACVGEILAHEPKRKPNPAQHDLGYHVLLKRAADGASAPWGVHCRAKCGDAVDGGVVVELVSTSKGLDAVHRSAESLPLVFGRTCQRKAVAPVRLALHFDDAGRLDVKHSRLH